MKTLIRAIAAMCCFAFSAGCGGSDAGLANSNGGTGGSGGAGPETGGTGGEIPECASDYAEPDLPYDDSVCGVDEILKRNTWFYAGSCLPEQASGGGSHLQYWLTGDEIPCIKMEIGLGDLFPGEEPVPVRVVVLVDGRQTPFAIDGSMQAEMHGFDLTPDTEDRARFFDICLEGSAPGPGLHLLSVLINLVGHGTAELMGPNFATIRDSTCFEDTRLLVQPVASEADDGVFSWVENAVTGAPLIGGGSGYQPIQSGRLPIRIHLHPWVFGSAEAPSDPLVVALVDEQEIPLGSLGFAPQLAAPSAQTDSNVFEVVLEGLPTDGERHRLTFVQVGGYGQMAADRTGTPNLSFSMYPWRITSFEFAEE